MLYFAGGVNKNPRVLSGDLAYRTS